jgi:hypothetical protein
MTLNSWRCIEMALTKYAKMRNYLLRILTYAILYYLFVVITCSLFLKYYLKEDMLNIIITISITILTLFAVIIIFYYLFKNGYLDGLIESLIKNKLIDPKKLGIENDKDDI